ncbi:HlyD family efflux transporter periplasmic adaptor subunit [Pedobacter petrophilus]|uniref:HlyD family efflux transporter periplasmic adaptor subunit n=1 Tax=Pedobacter petrophilus TaxID=1908241 RepID=A0A7K0G4M1_9SPHI|nr:HlyD family efflux transporter periplasmic adaptor subunit [Pedobacter petrophilus]MRX77926.1 HlyD family efflux transporter periplasmic adaptor subunit [Pedobacter petrophilus]
MKETEEHHEEKFFHEAMASDEVREIITAIPSWIIRWGIMLIFLILVGIVMGSAFIEYPDVVKTNLKVNSTNSPKAVLSERAGKLIRILVVDGQIVTPGQPLAYLESVADHRNVLELKKWLKKLQSFEPTKDFTIKPLPANLVLGELQASFQSFYQQYLQYLSTRSDGYYVNKLVFLGKDLRDIDRLREQIFKQKKIQQQEYSNQEAEYNAYQKLYKNNVISRSEFIQQQNKYLSSQYPLQQTETALLNNITSYNAKDKELLDLKHTIKEEQGKFTQSLNKCLTDIDSWLLQNVLSATVGGKLTFAGILQPNQYLTQNQEVFIINPGNADFFGEVQIPQYNMGKVRLRERVLIKLHSYPFEQYGMISGKLTYISDVAYRDSVFIAKVSFEKVPRFDKNYGIVLKNGMLADAEIITEESSLLRRFFRNFIKIFKKHQ